MARWTASAKWGEAPALDGQRDMPLALSLSEGLGISDEQCVLIPREQPPEVSIKGDQMLAELRDG
jgi:hypothetical protein